MIPHTKHLKAFLAVSREGSMKKAGEQLRRAQSAVSRSIQELESTLDAPLFERNARGMLMTEFGKTLLKRVELAFAEMEAARTALLELCSADGVKLRNAPVFSLSVGEKRLEVLIAFADRRHMGAVARQLKVSQPAVSMAVRDLETSTGLTLFDRSSSGMRLTPMGELLLMHIKRALAQLRLASAEIAGMKGVVAGHVTIGALPFGRAYILPVAIARLARKHPQLSFTTVEGPFEALIHGLWCGDIDLVLGALRTVEQYAELVREDLFSDRMAVIARKDHPLVKGKVKGKRSSVRGIMGADWVLPMQGTPTRDVLASAFEALGGEQPRVVVESSDLSIIRGLLLESDMITAASRHLFHHELQAGSLVALPIELDEAWRSIGVMRRAQEHASPGAQLLIEEIRAIRDERGGGVPGTTR